MRGPNVGEASSRRAMPPPGTLSTPTFTFGSTARNTVPTMLPSDWPTKLIRFASTPPAPSRVGVARESSSRSATPWRRLSREVSRLVRLMK